MVPLNSQPPPTDIENQQVEEEVVPEIVEAEEEDAEVEEVAEADAEVEEVAEADAEDKEVAEDADY